MIYFTELRTECQQTVRVVCLITISLSSLSVMDTIPNQMSGVYKRRFVVWKNKNMKIVIILQYFGSISLAGSTDTVSNSIGKSQIL